MPNLNYDSLSNGLDLAKDAGQIDIWHPVTTKQGHRRWEVWVADYSTREPLILTDREVHVLLVGLVTASKHREEEMRRNPMQVRAATETTVRAVKILGRDDDDETAAWYASGRLSPSRVVWRRLHIATHATRAEAEAEVKRLYPNRFEPITRAPMFEVVGSLTYDPNTDTLA